MKKNLLVLLSLLVIASMSLAACGSVQTQDPPAPAAEIVVNGDASPQILGLQPKEGYQIAILFNADYDDPQGGKIATFSAFGESTPPTEIVAKVTVDNVEYPLSPITIGENFTIPSPNVDAYINNITIHMDGWFCDQREGLNIWDCNPK